MKRIIIFTSTLYLLFSCNKERDVLTWDDYNPAPVHCTNGILDSNELGIDCGGNCDPCDQLTPPCTLLPNTFDIEGFSPKTLLSSDHSVAGSNHIIEFEYEDDFTVTFTFFGFPSISHFYSLDNYPDDDNEVKVTLNITGTSYIGVGSMIITYDSGIHEFHVCSGSFTILGSAYSATYHASHAF